MLVDECLGFSGVFSTRKAGSGPQFGADHLGIGAGRRLRRLRRRSANFFRQRFVFHQQLYFVGVDYFAFEQRQRDALERFAIGGQQRLGAFVAAVDDALHFLVDLDGGVFRVVAMLGNFAAEEDGFIFLTVRQRTELAHAPFANHVTGDVGGALDVVPGAGSNVA